MMLLESLAVGAVGVASDILENASILPAGYPTFRAGDAADLAAKLERVVAWDDAARESAAEQGRHPWPSPPNVSLERPAMSSAPPCCHPGNTTPSAYA